MLEPWWITNSTHSPIPKPHIWNIMFWNRIKDNISGSQKVLYLVTVMLFTVDVTWRWRWAIGERGQFLSYINIPHTHQEKHSVITAGGSSTAIQTHTHWSTHTPHIHTSWFSRYCIRPINSHWPLFYRTTPPISILSVSTVLLHPLTERHMKSYL